LIDLSALTFDNDFGYLARWIPPLKSKGVRPSCLYSGYRFFVCLYRLWGATKVILRPNRLIRREVDFLSQSSFLKIPWGEDTYRWYYAAVEDSLTHIKWVNPNTLPDTVVTDASGITYTDGHLTKIEADIVNKGFKYTYTASYAAGALQKITWLDSRSPTKLWNYDLEYQGGKAVQYTKYSTTNGTPGTSTSYSWSYNSDGNITQVVVTGSSSKTYTFTYDNKANMEYGNEALGVISMGEVSGLLNHFWGLPFMLTLTKNNVTEMATSGTTEKHSFVYAYDSQGNIQTVADNWTPASGSSYNTSWAVSVP